MGVVMDGTRDQHLDTTTCILPPDDTDKYWRPVTLRASDDLVEPNSASKPWYSDHTQVESYECSCRRHFVVLSWFVPHVGAALKEMSSRFSSRRTDLRLRRPLPLSQPSRRPLRLLRHHLFHYPASIQLPPLQILLSLSHLHGPCPCRQTL